MARVLRDARAAQAVCAPGVPVPVRAPPVTPGWALRRRRGARGRASGGARAEEMVVAVVVGRGKAAALSAVEAGRPGSGSAPGGLCPCRPEQGNYRGTRRVPLLYKAGRKASLLSRGGEVN